MGNKCECLYLCTNNDVNYLILPIPRDSAKDVKIRYIESLNDDANHKNLCVSVNRGCYPIRNDMQVLLLPALLKYLPTKSVIFD